MVDPDKIGCIGAELSGYRMFGYYTFVVILISLVGSPEGVEDQEIER